MKPNAELLWVEEDSAFLQQKLIMQTYNNNHYPNIQIRIQVEQWKSGRPLVLAKYKPQNLNYLMKLQIGSATDAELSSTSKRKMNE